MTRLWSFLKPLAEGLFAAFFGLALGAILMRLWGYDPLAAYAALFQGAFGAWYHAADTLAAATPLLLTGLTFAIGIRAGLFNIGSQGQVFVGAVAAVAASLFWLPPGTHLVVSILFGMVAGALWSVPTAFLKATRGVHEVISTIMLNWIGRYFCLYLAATWLADPNRAEKTISVAQGARLPSLAPGTDLTYAIYISIFFAVVVYWMLWHTAIGYEIRSVGLNSEASRYGGMKPARTMGVAFVLGGLASGLAGALQVLSPPTYALQGSLSNVENLGFEGIAVALIGRNHPLGVIMAAVFIGALGTGAREMQISARVDLEMVKVVQGAIILALAVPELSNLFSLLRRSRG